MSDTSLPVPIVRLLTPADVDALLVLEHRQWEPHQAATREMLQQRISSRPDLAIGAFCPHSGQAQASLFLRLISEARISAARRWDDCANASGDEAPQQDTTGQSLFGISLTSVRAEAIRPMQALLWVQAIRLEARSVYLGSPMPGLRRAMERDPALDPQAYARTLRNGLPLDPQLRYYHARGFHDIVAVLPDYFPHEASLDHGAMLRHVLPWSQWAPLLKELPDPLLMAMAAKHYGDNAPHPATPMAEPELALA